VVKLRGNAQNQGMQNADNQRIRTFGRWQNPGLKAMPPNCLPKSFRKGVYLSDPEKQKSL
jgi:hypothetical protein